MATSSIPVLSVAGILVVGLVAAAGAVAVSTLAAWLMRVGHALVVRAVRIAGPAAVPGGRGTPVATRPAGGGLDPQAHALLARQAWWRLRC
jgi:hypothetical protein